MDSVTKRRVIDYMLVTITTAITDDEIDIEVDDHYDTLTWYINGYKYQQSIACDSPAAIIVDMAKTVKKIIDGTIDSELY